MGPCWSSDSSPVANSTPPWWRCPSRGCCRWPKSNLPPRSRQRERLVTYAAKWDSGSAADLATAPRCPARVDGRWAERIEQAALAAFEVTGCRDYARVDLRVADDGRAFTSSRSTAIPTLVPRPVSPGRWARRESAMTSSSTAWWGTQQGGGASQPRPSNSIAAVPAARRRNSSHSVDVLQCLLARRGHRWHRCRPRYERPR